MLDVSDLGNRRIDGLHINDLSSTVVATGRVGDTTNADLATFAGDEADEADPDEDETQTEAQRLFLPWVTR